VAKWLQTAYTLIYATLRQLRAWTELFHRRAAGGYTQPTVYQSYQRMYGRLHVLVIPSQAKCVHVDETPVFRGVGAANALLTLAEVKRLYRPRGDENVDVSMIRFKM